MKEENPIALAAYELLSDRYAQLAQNKAENGYIEHPAMKAALGEVNGLEVLEAGCGPGFLIAHLVANGARVTAFDVSPKMIALATARAPECTDIFVSDMSKPLPNISTEKFDIVASSLAIDYVRDWTIPLSEFWRALKPKGRLILSVQHPLGAYLWYKPPTAFGVHSVEATWRGFGGEPVKVPNYYRSLEEMVNPISAAGFRIKKVTDTKPIESLRERDLINYEKYSKQPTFMIIEADKL